MRIIACTIFWATAISPCEDIYTQLIAETITLDKWEKTPKQPILLDGITIDTIWQFAWLNRNIKHFEQSLDSYRVSEDLDELMHILVAALA